MRHIFRLDEAEARVVVRALDAYRQEVVHPSGPIPADEDDYEIATRVVERLVVRAVSATNKSET